MCVCETYHFDCLYVITFYYCLLLATMKILVNSVEALIPVTKDYRGQTNLLYKLMVIH